jgi:hypothetical protein
MQLRTQLFVLEEVVGRFPIRIYLRLVEYNNKTLWNVSINLNFFCLIYTVFRQRFRVFPHDIFSNCLAMLGQSI